MILGIGVDMVAVERMFKWLENTALMERYFTQGEITYVKNRGEGAAASLAARYAAKEAFGKALGRGLKGISLKDISVQVDGRGKPCFVLSGTAGEALKETGGTQVHLSLSHDASLAIAQVIIEGEDHG